MNNSEDGHSETNTAPRPRSLFGKRHIQYILMFSAIAVSYGMRTILSVAIIAMIERHPPYPDIPTYPEWKNSDTILSSFFWGYVTTQIVAGQLAERFGPKWFLFSTMLAGTILNTFIPLIAQIGGFTGVVICRVLFGLNQGFVYPSIQHLVSKWTPLPERSLFANFIYSGSALGIVVAMPVAGAICESRWGWPVAFYLYGGLALLWVALWGYLAADRPSKHTTITSEEKNYVEENCKGNSDGNGKKVATPWKAIVKSLPMWAIIIGEAGQGYGSYMLITEIPTYLDNIMGLDIGNNGLLSAMPYVASLVVYIAAAPVADKLIGSRILGIGGVRKLFQTIACVFPATALIWLAFIDKGQKDLAVVLLIVAVGFAAANTCGDLINTIDLAPNHAGTLFGIVNSLANVCSMLGPLTLQFIGTNKKDPILWRKAFCLAAGVYIGSGSFYVIFSSGEIQPWNDFAENETAEPEEKSRKRVK